MSNKWTNEQKQAIEERNNNILVSAAAGSGKTAVLVQRVVDMVTDKNNPVYINHLLVATFTNAAAAEMKDRIYIALQEKLKDNPNDTFLKEQLVLLGQAQISTVHSFCTNLIRENFHLLGIRHDFDIADEVRLATIKKNALELVLEEKYNDSDVDFYNTVDAFGGKKDDSGLEKIVMKVFSFSESLPDSEIWLKDCYENLNNELYINKIKNYVIDSIKSDVEEIIKDYDRAIEIIDNDAGIAGYMKSFLEDKEFFEKILGPKNNDTIELVNNFKFKNIGHKKSDADHINTECVKEIREDAKARINELKILYCYSDEMIDSEIKAVFPYVKTICTLVMNFKKKFSEMKEQENILDFNDLEHYAIRLLEENEDLREYLKGFYTEILVDEYQDTNGVQAHLFNLLSNGKNLFTVGDVKQSIYGFRNSNPKYFLEKYDSFDFENSEKGIKINLSKNFRSSNAIISGINNFFEKLMISKVGGVSYNDGHALVFGNDEIKDIDSSVERYVINTSKKDNDSFDEDKHTLEAIFVANKIYDLVEVKKPEIYDKKEKIHRPVTYKDIVVLMRKTKNLASQYAEVFADRGIPVYTAESGGYFNCIEIATVISFLNVIENPLQDIPLLAVMRSPIFGFDDNYIAKIRSDNREIHFYDLLKKSDDPKVMSFVGKIDELREFAKYNNISSLVRKIIFDTGYYYFVGNLPNGDFRIQNLNLLCERAGSFSAKSHKTVSDFISYVKSMIESKNEYSSPKLCSENDNVVNIMSIHKSKGLEFPVVFLCETGMQFNKDDLKANFIYDEEYGLAMNIIDVEKRLKFVPFLKKAICMKKKDELIAEEIRLLYVALTRAKYKLIITGTTAYKGSSSDDDMSSYRIKLYNNYLDMLLLKNKYIPDAVVYNVSDVLNSDNIIFEHKDVNKTEFDYSEFYDAVSERLEFSYAYAENKMIPSKKSISEIADGTTDVILNHISIDDSGVTPAQRGTLVHFVLQNIDLKNVGDISSIVSQINSMTEKKYFDSKYKDIIDVNAIYDFFVSDIGKRMLSSEEVYREFKFCVDVPANELGYDSEKETVLVQGVIDCCFLEEDEFVIIDYKTGSLSDKYKTQIQLYKRCLEISTGRKVKETCIYPLI